MDGKEIEIKISEVKVGDVILVKPGQKIPVDGVITAGSSFIDEAMVTGEPMPKEKKIGDTVVAGTINTNSAFTFKATKVGSETLLAHIVKMVQDAQGSKAPIQALADKISGVFVPIVLGIAFVTLLTWLGLGTYYLGFSKALQLCSSNGPAPCFYRRFNFNTGDKSNNAIGNTVKQATMKAPAGRSHL